MVLPGNELYSRFRPRSQGACGCGFCSVDFESPADGLRVGMGGSRNPVPELSRVEVAGAEGRAEMWREASGEPGFDQESELG